MKVLQVTPELSAGGVERTTLEIAQALTARGDEAHVASAGGRLEGELVELGGVLHKMPAQSKNPLVVWQNAARLTRLIKELNIDILHARSRAPALSCAIAAKRTGVFYVTTYHGIYNAKSGLKRWYNGGMARSDAVIANSEFTRDHIMKEHGLSEDKITVIPRGVDMARFDPDCISMKAEMDLRESWGVGRGETLILLPGRLTRWKGQEVAIKALKPDMACKLVLLGDPQGRDAYVAELKNLAEQNGVTDKVLIPGHFDDMPSAFAASDIVLSTSTDPEAFGRVAAEAQAMGCWVIASDHGGARETVIEGVTGWRVAPGDDAALRSALSNFMDNGAPKDYDAQNSRAHIEQNFSKRALQEKTLAVYDRLLAQKAQ